MEHLTIHEIVAYVNERLSEDESFKVDHHLTECEECARRVDDHILVQEQFDELWDSWTAEEHAKELLQAHVLESLSHTRVPPAIRVRLARWAANIAAQTASVLGIVMDASRRTARILQEGLGGIGTMQASLQPVRAPVRTRGAVGGAAVRSRRAITVESSGPTWVKVDIDPSAAKITVWTEPQKEPWPLVLLVPKKKGRAAIGEFRRAEAGDRLVSEFEQVADGEYFLFLESATRG
jgi:anti-sigma factor RsiW